MQRRVEYLVLLAVLLLPSTVFAQATLTGTVRDNNQGVLPGVTVEAASPALIEKVRTVTVRVWPPRIRKRALPSRRRLRAAVWSVTLP